MTDNTIIKEQINTFCTHDYIMLNLPFYIQSNLHHILTSKTFIDKTLIPLLSDKITVKTALQMYMFKLIIDDSGHGIMPITNLPKTWRTTLINMIMRDHYHGDTYEYSECFVILEESLRKLHHYPKENKSSSQKYRMVMKTLIAVEKEMKEGKFYEPS